MSGQELKLDPKKTALVLIDLQGAIVGRDTAPYTASDVVARCAKLAEAVRSAGSPVFYVHVLIAEFMPRITDAQGPRAAGPLPPEATQIVPAAGMKEGDFLVSKRQWGAFNGTSLEQQLRRKGIDTIILGGIATNLGVESTARAAQDLDYNIVFAEDAMTSMSKEWHDFAVKNTFPRIGRVRSTEQVIAALE